MYILLDSNIWKSRIRIGVWERTCVFRCCYSRLDHLLSLDRWYVLNHSCRYQKNSLVRCSFSRMLPYTINVGNFIDNGLFCWRRRDVLLETTCCFVENDVLFCWKWRVVLLKTTCCFSHTMGGIEKNKRRVENEGRREGTLESRNEIVKIPIIPPLARTRTRALTGVLSFLLSQVSHTE